MTITVYPPFGSTVNNAIYTQFGGGTVDAFGRLRVSNPYTIFDSQARFAPSIDYDYVTNTGASTSYNTNQSSVNLTLTSASAGATALAQTKRVFPYQPGKGLLTMQTFVMGAPQTGLTQRVGYYGAQNGVYLEQADTQISFVIRTYTGGTVDNSRYAVQSDWSVDKLDGTGPSGITLDLTKMQILWFDFEWLGSGNLRCGFIINGVYIVCHIFENANIKSTVYIQTAILPLRYEITATDSVASANLVQICSTVISEGGYDEISQLYEARRGDNGLTIANNTGLDFTPIVSIRVNSSYYGSVVIPSAYDFFPISSGSTGYEVVMIRNGTLTSPTWAAATMCNGQVDVDIGATAVTVSSVDDIMQTAFASSTAQAVGDVAVRTLYNFKTQIGYTASLTGNGFGASDVLTIAARGINNSPVGSGTGNLSFYCLTL